MKRLLQDPVSAGMLLIALIGVGIGYIEFRLQGIQEQTPPIVQLDPQQVRAVLQRSGEDPSPQAVAERLKQISRHYADRGYIVLDQQAVLDAPGAVQVDVQP